MSIEQRATRTARWATVGFLVPALISLSVARVAAGEYETEVGACLAWIEQNRHPHTGLPFSHVGDPRFRAWTITYDAAITALAYVAAGREEEAGKIIDYYIEQPDVWRLGGVIEAYVASGTPKGKDWSVRSGANLWLGLACVHTYHRTRDSKYLDIARRIGKLALMMQNKDKSDPNYGGLPLGPKGDPAHPGDQHLGHDKRQLSFTSVYSSEVNVDAYAFLRAMHGVTGDRQYQRAGKKVRTWLERKAYNGKLHRLNRGYLDATSASDVQSWAISALGVDGLDEMEKGLAESMVQYVDRNCVSQAPYTKPDGRTVRVRGVDFVDKDTARTLKRKPLVSPEWTFQLVNAYRRMEKDYTGRSDEERAMLYGRKWKELLVEMLKLGVRTKETLGFPYATEPNALIGHEYRTPGEGTLSAIGPAYAILAMTGYDPLVWPPETSTPAQARE